MRGSSFIIVENFTCHELATLLKHELFHGYILGFLSLSAEQFLYRTILITSFCNQKQIIDETSRKIC